MVYMHLLPANNALSRIKRLETPDKNIDFSLKVSILKSIKEQHRPGGRCQTGSSGSGVGWP
jgi:hypothetical protein